MPPPVTGSLYGRIVAAVRTAFDPSKLDITKLKAERDRIVARMDSRNPPITCVVPVPRVVLLGGVAHVVHELRLRDLASLQVWIEEQVPHPLAEIPPGWCDPEPLTRPARLAAAWRVASCWPPRFGTPEASKLLATVAGQTCFLDLVLRDPSIGLGGLRELFERITPLEWAMVRRVAYAISPREEIADELAPDQSPGMTANWALSAYRASRHDGGPGFKELGDWTISQWRIFCGEGRAGEYGTEFAAQYKRVTALVDTL